MRARSDHCVIKREGQRNPEMTILVKEELVLERDSEERVVIMMYKYVQSCIINSRGLSQWKIL